MRTKLRVAMAAPWGRACGIGDYAAFLAQALGTKHDLSWLDLPAASSVEAWQRAAAQADKAQIVHVHFEPSLFNIPRPYCNRFATFLNRLRPPVLVSLHDAIPSLRPRWMEKKPYVLFDLVRDLAYLPFYLWWEKMQYRRAQHWLVHSPELASTVARLTGSEPVSQTRIPVPPVGGVWSAHEDHSLDLVSPGFIKPHKGYDVLLDLLPNWNQLTWDLAGSPQDAYDSAFAGKFKIRIEELGLKERVRITGYLSRRDLEEHAVRAKAAVFPFNWAAGSSSLTWAIGLGLPVLATNLPPFVEFQEAGAGIELLPLDRRDLWPGLIDSILQDPARQLALSRANLDYARTNGYVQLASQVEHIYCCLAETRRVG